MIQYKKGKDNLMAVALSRKVQTKDDLASDVLYSKAKSVNPTFEDDLDSQEGVLCMLSFPSPAWLTNLKQVMPQISRCRVFYKL